MVFKAGTATLATLLLAGCATGYSPVPLATNYPTTKQAQVQAAAHWKAISARIEKQLGPALRQSPNIPLYVETAQPTAFGQTVAAELITSLVNDGYVVGKSPNGALKVDIETQVVKFTPNRPQYRFEGQPLTFDSESWAITDATAPAPGAPRSRDAYAWFRTEFAAGKTPETEIIITISVSDERRYYARSTSVYYVTDRDRSLYEVAPKEKTELTKTFTVRGG